MHTYSLVVGDEVQEHKHELDGDVEDLVISEADPLLNESLGLLVSAEELGVVGEAGDLVARSTRVKRSATYSLAYWDTNMEKKLRKRQRNQSIMRERSSTWMIRSGITVNDNLIL